MQGTVYRFYKRNVNISGTFLIRQHAGNYQTVLTPAKDTLHGS